MDCYDYVSEKDIRKCQYYVRYIESPERSGIRSPKYFDWRNKSGNMEGIRTWIDGELNYHFERNVRDIKRFASKMESSCKDEILPIKEFACGCGIKQWVTAAGVGMYFLNIRVDLMLLSNILMQKTSQVIKKGRCSMNTNLAGKERIIHQILLAEKTQK